jgi:hypothetical protein
MTGGAQVLDTKRASSPARPTRGIRVAVALITVFTVLALIPGGVLARGKPAPAPVGGGTVVVAPNPVAMGATYTISGSGWAPGSVHAVKVTTPSATQYLFAFVDGSGRFLVYNNTWERGTFPVEVWQSGVKRPAMEARTSVSVT